MQIDDIQMCGERPHYPHKGCMTVRWSSERGFGEYTILKMEDGTFVVDTECDGKELVKQAFCKLIDDAVRRD